MCPHSVAVGQDQGERQRVHLRNSTSSAERSVEAGVRGALDFPLLCWEEEEGGEEVDG
jgi:hypothetical protein